VIKNNGIQNPNPPLNLVSGKVIEDR